MKRLPLFLLKIALAGILAMTIGIAVLYWYISTHEKEIIEKVETAYTQNFYGHISIQEVNLDWRKQFPFCSAVLKNVVVKDSNWNAHQQNGIQIDYAYVRFKILPLLIGKVNIQKIILRDASLHLFKQSDGLENFSILKRRHQTKEKRLFRQTRIPKIRCERLHIRIENELKNKSFDFYTDLLQLQLKNEKGRLVCQLKTKAIVKDCSFNRAKGSFFKNQAISFNGVCQYQTDSAHLSFTDQTALADKNKLVFSADLFFGHDEPYFELKLSAQQLIFKTALESLSTRIAQKLDPFYLNQPFGLSLIIKGKLRDQPNPHIILNARVRNNQLISDFGNFDACNFDAYYTNGKQKDSAFGDLNSFISLRNVKAQLSGIDFTTDSTYVYNLKAPIISTIIRANFPIRQLNQLVGKKSFRYGDGKVALKVKYTGSLDKSKAHIGDMSGFIDVTDAEVKYRPRHLKFKHCDIHIELDHDDIILHESVLHSERSTIRCKAMAQNFLSLYLDDPEKISFDAEVYSEHIDLNEFESFLNKRYSRGKARKYAANLPDKIDKALDLSSTRLHLNLAKVVYKKFDARNIKADINLLANGISMQNVLLDYAGGNIAFEGSIRDEKDNQTSFEIGSKLKNIKLDALLEDFDNFGLKDLNAENIEGKVSMRNRISGLFDDSSHLVPGSIKAIVDFELREGALIHFKPLEKIGRFAFRKKRLSEVHFQTLRNTVRIEGNAIHIPPMMIRSNLINLQLSGVYHLDTGTRLDIIIPLFGSDKDNLNPKGLFSLQKGFMLHVRSEDDAEGNLRFKWKIRNKEISDALEERRQLKEQLQKR